jgi:DNA-binding SARP family transcriptional activator
VEFRILGPLELIDDEGGVFELAGSKRRALLTLLLLHANQVVSSDRLLDELWGDQPPASGVTALQVSMSKLRKMLGAAASVLETRPPGYRLRLGPDQLDLSQFEALADEASELEPAQARAKLRQALNLWRGPPLAEFAYEPFAQVAIARLEELRLVVLERRLSADLACGRHDEIVAELDALVVEHPLRERLRAQLMLALYRCGRQAEALAAYRTGREALVDGIGIEPSPDLRELEAAILRQDPALRTVAGLHAPSPGHGGPVILCASSMEALEWLLAVAIPLARALPSRELIAVRLAEAKDLPESSLLLHDHAEALRESGVRVRVAASTPTNAGKELTTLASEQDADLVLLHPSTDSPESDQLGSLAGLLLDSLPCDVGLVAGAAPETARPGLPVLVPFSGGEHDWAAIELAAWIAHASGATLRLIGRDAGTADHDASHLLARASLLVQQVVHVPTEIVLAPAGSESLVTAAEDAALLIFGLSPRWRREGLGETRRAIAHRASCPTMLIRKGVKPGGIAPAKASTRFTWSLAASH